MESVNYGASGSGAELDRALMDLGPLLGVTIKEETPDDTADPNSTSRSNGENSVTDGSGAAAASGEGKVEGGGGGEAGEGADSLASPAPPATERCVLCAVPLTLADGTPMLMECLHSACEPCLKAKINEKMASNMQRDFLGAERISITCPECRLPCAASNMIEQRFVLEKLSAEREASAPHPGPERTCSSCEDTEPATAYCVDCAEFICDNCVQAHQRLKITKDHTIKSKEEALQDQQAAQGGARTARDMFCRDHPQERLSLFCETCDRLTCRDCQLHHHRDHKYQFSTEMAAQARASIESLLAEVSYKRVLLASAMKVIRDRQTLIADKKKALVHEITQTVVKLTNAINSRGKQLVLRLSEVCDSKQRTLKEKKDALEHLAAVTHHAANVVRNALDTGSDTAVLYSRGALTRHLQRVKSRRADIPNPEIPVRIGLSLDNLPELLRVVSSVGAIVVDGKVDGGGAAGGSGGGAGGGAQGPYHPPATLHPSPGPHNAVVALQQAAAMQSYVASGGSSAGWVSPLAALASGGGPPQPQPRPRPQPPHTPLRYPHVTSTTHPHHLQGMNELNLRGLLNAAGAAAGAAGGRPQPRAPPPNMQHHHSQYHQYQHMMGAAYAAAGAGGGGGGARGGRGGMSPRTPSPAPHYPAPPPHAKWHIPQHAIANGGLEQGGMAGGGGGGADFKITLGRQHPAPAPAPAPAPLTPGRTPNVVTSTNPKTPSPSLNGSSGGASSGALELDAVCAESVQDLMATIAKLDSNGVQVVAEAESPHTPPVHSSTAASAGAGVGAGLGVGVGGGHPDPNEDWCAVCMDGGELMCCDKCPKVFHQYCHIPTIEKLPDETETWQCLLCVNFAELEVCGEARMQKVMERITLELYCQYELSLPFREPVPIDNTHYHSKISRPMCLDMIRAKLQPRSPARYGHVTHFIQDCRLLFKNAFAYNPVDSQIYKDAKRLEEFFEVQVSKLVPEYLTWPPSPSPGPALPAPPHLEPAPKRPKH